MENNLSDEIIYALTAAPQFGSSPQAHCYAACSSGLMRSTDGGKTWHHAFESLNLPDPVPVTTAFLPLDPSSTPTVLAGLVGGILRSQDGLTGWERLPLPLPPPAISAIIASPNYAQDNILFAATLEDGVLWSSNRGDHWINWNFGLLDLNILSLCISPAFGEDETLFAGAQSGVFRTTNGGRAWREVDLPIGYDAVLSMAVSPGFKQDGIVFAGTEMKGLLCSSDGGDTWQQIAPETITGSVNAILLDPDFPSRPEILVLVDGTALYSADQGITWQTWQPEITQDREVTAVFAPNGFQTGKPALIGMVGGDIHLV
jgi:photosystem II stability/assembly factor-like uncharacterized protein